MFKGTLHMILIMSVLPHFSFPPHQLKMLPVSFSGHLICIHHQKCYLLFADIRVALFVTHFRVRRHLLLMSEQIIHPFWNSDSQPACYIKNYLCPRYLFKIFCQISRDNTPLLNTLITFYCCFSLL